VNIKNLENPERRLRFLMKSGLLSVIFLFFIERAEASLKLSFFGYFFGQAKK
jgi:hypothetical protein